MFDRRTGRSLPAAARVLALGLGLAAAALPQAARAQFFGGWGGWDNGGAWDGMGPRQVRQSITEQGFRVLAPLRRNGNVFVADVIDPRGRRERLIVAAADAQILQRFYIDDGRAPGGFGRGDGTGLAARDPDQVDRGGLVPPALIPDGGRRFNDVRGGVAPAPRLGDLNDDSGTALVPALPTRPRPPLRTVRPQPRVVERTPDSAIPQREPTAVESTPLAPAAPRPRIVEPQRAPAIQAPAAVASRPEPATPPASQPPPSQPRRLSDPLAIPGAGPKAAGTPVTPPVRSVSGAVTGAPAAAAPAPAAPAPAPAKPADVPVAPLD